MDNLKNLQKQKLFFFKKSNKVDKLSRKEERKHKLSNIRNKKGGIAINHTNIKGNIRKLSIILYS